MMRGRDGEEGRREGKTTFDGMMSNWYIVCLRPFTRTCIYCVGMISHGFSGGIASTEANILFCQGQRK